MSVALPYKHIVHQTQAMAMLGGASVDALRQRFKPVPAHVPSLPGAELRAHLPPRPPALVRDYLRHVGGDPGAYKGTLPPHLFPQWTFPLAARTLRGLPYPMVRAVNGGCRIEMNARLPAHEPLDVSARLDSIDDNGRRAVLRQRVVTGTASCPEALVVHLYVIVPLSSPHERKLGSNGVGRGNGALVRKEAARVPPAARELSYWKLRADAGLAFALLTGDFNPIHWVRAYARSSGFKSTILHGFATMARAMEGLNRALYAGATDRIYAVDVKFTRPLVLPARVGLYLDGRACFVGDAPGGPAYLTGSFEENATSGRERLI